VILKVIGILGLLILVGLIYRLAWRLQSLLTPVEQAVANARQAAADAAEALATAIAVLEAVTAPVDEPADEPDTDEYPAYVLVDNCAADTHPTEPAAPAVPNWVEEQLATFTFMEGHQR
jgi:hypothetical protein